MTPEEQRIAIAKACGWKISNLSVGRYCWSHPRLCAIGGPSVLAQGDPVGLPDYLSDLNAINEAVLSLTGPQQDDFQEHLWRVVAEKPEQVDGRKTYKDWRNYTNATARQRAEAFLRTLNLWVE
jgi:hypothetical protein